MPRPERWFLDSNVWNGLASGNAPLTRSRLTAAVRAGRLEIVGSFELYEEILGTATRDPAKYQSMRRAFARLCPRTVLLPLRDRHRAEIVAGGELPEPGRYVPRSDVKRLTAAEPGALVDVVNEQVHELKQRSIEEAKAIKASLQQNLAAVGRKAREFDRRVSARVVSEAVDGVLTAMAGRGVDRPEEASPETVPSLWLLTSAHAAFATLGIENRRISGSDGHDMMHCSAGAYFDVLVSDDRRFLEALSIIDGLPFEFITARAAVARSALTAASS